MSIILKITQSEDGQVNVEGPIENRIFCYGLLEIAKEIIHKYNEEKEKNKITIPTIKFPINPNGN